MARKPAARGRPKKGELLDAHGRPIGGNTGAFVYTAKGDIYRQRIVIPTDKVMRDEIEKHLDRVKVQRPLTMKEQDTVRRINKLGSAGLLELYIELVEKTPNPEHVAFLEALKNEGDKLTGIVRKKQRERRVVAH